MSRRADFLQLVAFALKEERGRKGAELLAEAQGIAEEALPLGNLFEAADSYVLWSMEKRRAIGVQKVGAFELHEPEWHREWRENQSAPKTLILARGHAIDVLASFPAIAQLFTDTGRSDWTVRDYTDFWEKHIPRSLVAFVVEARAYEVVSEQDAARFKAWVEQLPDYEPTDPPYVFNPHKEGIR